MCVWKLKPWLAKISQGTFTLDLIKPESVYIIQTWNYIVVNMIPNCSESNELDLSEFLEGSFSWINRIYIVMDLFKIVQLAWDTKWIIVENGEQYGYFTGENVWMSYCKLLTCIVVLYCIDCNLFITKMVCGIEFCASILGY